MVEQKGGGMCNNTGQGLGGELCLSSKERGDPAHPS